MTIFDGRIGADYFDRIRLGLLSYLIMPHAPNARPVEGDQLRLGCILNRQIINEMLLDIIKVSDVPGEKNTVRLVIIPNKALVFTSK